MRQAPSGGTASLGTQPFPGQGGRHEGVRSDPWPPAVTAGNAVHTWSMAEEAGHTHGEGHRGTPQSWAVPEDQPGY